MVNNDGRVQSLARAFDLLEHLADAGGSLTLSQLAATSGLPLPTIHRLMRSLVGTGYVRQEPSRRYALGPRLIRLGESAASMLGSWAMPYLAGLVDRIGETANMAILEGDSVVYVAQVPSPHSVRMFTEVGRRVLLHSPAWARRCCPRSSRRRGARARQAHRHAGADREHDHPPGPAADRAADDPGAGVRGRRGRAGTRCAVRRGPGSRRCRFGPPCRSPARTAA